MATETAEQQKVTVEDAGAALKRITVEIPAATVDEKIESSFSMVSGRVALPGFRPGKAPKALVERRFGKSVRDEVRAELVDDGVQKAIETEELKPIGRPQLKDAEKIEVEPGKPLAFTFEIEVTPEFELPDLAGLEIMKPTLEVTDEMIEEELTNQRRRMGQLEDVEGEPAADDLFFGAVEVRNEEGEVVAQAPETVTRLPDPAEDEGAGAVGGIRIAKLHDRLKGHKPGETVEFETTGPENHEIEAIRDQKVTVSFRIDRLAKLIPAESAELVQRFGLADENELRERIREALSARIQYEQQDAMRRQVTKALHEQIELDLPEKASAAQAQRTLENMRMRLLQRGVPEYQVEERMASLRDASAEQAQRELKIFFILEKVAEQFDVNVTEQEVNARIATIAREQGVRPEQMRQQMMQSGRVGMLYSQVRHEKAADAVIERATVKEISAEEWNKMMEDEDQPTEAAGASSAKKTTKKSSSKKETKKKTTKKGSTKKTPSKASGEKEEA